MTPFFLCPVGMSIGLSGCRLGVRFFCIRQARFYYIADQQVVDFIIFSLCLWRTMILLSELVASRAERAKN